MSSPTGRECYRDRAEDSFGMHVCHLRRSNRFGDNSFRIAGVKGTQRGDPHGRTVAAGTLVIERGSGRRPPVHAVADSTQRADR